MKKIIIVIIGIVLINMGISQDLSIYFDKNKDIVQKEHIKSLSSFLKKHKPTKLLLNGYADSTGTFAYNKKLINKRLNHVEAEILAFNKNIKIDKFNIGESSSLNLLQNRKVDIYLPHKADKTITNKYKKANTFIINNSKEVTINCPEGTKVKIPKNSFVYKGSNIKVSGDIQLNITEYYKLSDILKAGLTTSSGKRILETGGMLKIEAKADNRLCELGKQSRIGISFKGIGIKHKMQLFSGKISNNNMEWKILPNISEKTEVIVEKFSMPKFQGKKCDYFSKYIQNNFIYPISAYQNKIESFNILLFDVEIDGTISNIRLNKRIHPAIDYQLARMLKNTLEWTPGKVNDKIKKLTTSIRLKLKITENTKIDSLNNITSYEEIPEEFKISYISEKRTKQEMKRASLKNKATEEFFLWTNQLDWINCDRFYDFPYKGNILVNVDSKKEKLFVVLKDTKSILRGNFYDKKKKEHIFKNLPFNKDLNIVSIKESNNQTYFSCISAKVNNETYTPLYKQLNEGELEDELKKLGW